MWSPSRIEILPFPTNRDSDQVAESPMVTDADQVKLKNVLFMSFESR